MPISIRLKLARVERFVPKTLGSLYADCCLPLQKDVCGHYAENRSEAAFAELVQRHLRPVYAVALRKVGGQSHLAQDVAQSVFTDLARKAGSLSRHPALTGWLLNSAHYAAGTLLRTERRRRGREQTAHLMNVLTAGSPTEHEWERLRPMLDDLISRSTRWQRSRL